MTEPPNGKSETAPTVTVTELTVPTVEKFTVLFGLSNGYDVAAENEWVRVIVPRMIPFPVRDEVIVTALLPVCNSPVVIFSVETLTLLLSVTVFVEALLLMVKVENVVAPAMVTLVLPRNWIVLVPAVNVPLFVQLLLIECVNVLALSVEFAPIVKSPLTVNPPPAVFVPPVAVERW